MTDGPATAAALPGAVAAGGCPLNERARQSALHAASGQPAPAGRADQG